MTDGVGPSMVLLDALDAIVARAAHHQTAHRVAYEHEFGDGNRPLVMQEVEDFGERAAIDGDMESGVIPQQNRGESQLVVQPFAIAEAVLAFARPPRPRPLGEAPAVHEDGNPDC